MTNLDWTKMRNLVPAIIQHAVTGQVLMLGYMNEEALETTQELGRVTFYSRSKQRLWTKGETSGNYLNVVSLHIDCDKDTVLVLAIPVGPTCHLGTNSCFGDMQPPGIGWLGHLADIIEDRRAADPNTSYTAQLLKGPIVRAAQKVGEEGVETALAAAIQDNDNLKQESADLLFHLSVVLAHAGLSLTDAVQVLRDRHDAKN